MALVTKDRLEAFQTQTQTHIQTRGNLYKGKLSNVEPGLQAAFVDIGLDRNAYLPFDAIHPEYHGYAKQREQMKNLLKKGQDMLIQIVKEETPLKGAAVTTYLSIPGRYLVLMPGSKHRGVSRKIEDEKERKRLKEILHGFKIPDGVGLIARTAANGISKTGLQKDLRYLLRLWENLKKRVKNSSAPALIYRDRDLAIRFLRDHLTSDVREIIVDREETFNEIKSFLRIISPRQVATVKLYKGDEPLFSHYGIEDQIDQIFQPRIDLPSGGYIIIEPTEALVSIDVNSGKLTKQKDLEETALATNMEAAEEVARQLRLRDLGGIIVIDFIDMRYRTARQSVEKHIRACLKEDRARTDISSISKFGLLAIARQKIGSPLEIQISESCPRCHGRGIVKSMDALSWSLLRKIRSQLAGLGKRRAERLRLRAAPEVALFLLNRRRSELCALEQSFSLEIDVRQDPALGLDEDVIEVEQKK